MHNIVETFYSIQGEGTHAGTAAFFIRFYGCNLQCDFGHGFVCDDEAHKNRDLILEYTDNDIVSMIPHNCVHVVLTGGEVSLNNVNPLIKKMQDKGIYVQVETNGYNIDNVSAADFVTYSPKSAFSSTAPDPKLTYQYSELKLLAGENNPVDEEKWSKVRIKFLQPIGYCDGVDNANTAYCVEYVKNHPDWRLSPQLHKYLGVL